MRLGRSERGSSKYEKAAMRWLERYLTECSPGLRRFAEVTASLARRRRALGFASSSQSAENARSRDCTAP
jgi:hypothetical protein